MFDDVAEVGAIAIGNGIGNITALFIGFVVCCVELLVKIWVVSVVVNKTTGRGIGIAIAPFVKATFFVVVETD